MFTDLTSTAPGSTRDRHRARNGVASKSGVLTINRPAPTRSAPPKTGRNALIVAGGLGVRLRPYTTLLPKPLVPIGEDHSILEIVLRQLAEQGFDKAILAIGHLGHLIHAYVGDGSQWGIEVDYFQEESPLGTIGPALMLVDACPDDFLVMNGDILTNINYADLLQTHIDSKAPLTIATFERETRIDFGVLDVSGDEVTRFREKPTLKYAVSMGVYAVARRSLQGYTPGTPLGFDGLITDLLERGEHPACYPFAGYWLDIGRPDDYDRANLEFDTVKSSLLRGL